MSDAADVVDEQMDPFQSEMAEVDDLRSKVNSLTKELAEAQDKLAVVQKELEKSEEERNKADKCCAELREKVELLNQELDKLRSDDERSMADIACQTDQAGHDKYAEGAGTGSAGPSDWVTGEGTMGTAQSVADSVRAAAEAAASGTGFVLDQTTGMYYDRNSGYYYDQVNQLYYDPNTGIYYYFDETTSSYQFHSQVSIPASSGSGKVHHGRGRGSDVKRTERRQTDEKRVRDERRRENVDDMDCQIIEMGQTSRHHYRRIKGEVSKAETRRFSKREECTTSRKDLREKQRSRERDRRFRRDSTEDVEVISNGHKKWTRRRRQSQEQRRKGHRESRLQSRRRETTGHRGDREHDEKRDHIAMVDINHEDVEMVSDGEILSDDEAKLQRTKGEVGQSQLEVCVDENKENTTRCASDRQDGSFGDQEEHADDEQSPDLVRGGSEDSTAKDDSQSGEEGRSDRGQGSSGGRANDTRNQQVIVKNPDAAVTKTESGHEERTERPKETDGEYLYGEVIDDVAIIEDGQELIILSSDEVEDGELSDSLSCVSSSEGSSLAVSEESAHWEDDLEEISSAESDNSGGVEVLKVDYPPCIRMIVTKSDTLKPGSLYIVTCSGGTIGREGSSHVMLIQSVKVSKRHAQIVYNSQERQYMIVDLGSQNGTMLNGKAISEQRVVSQPHPLSHCDYITIGGTTLRLHIHSGDETCEECEPGQVQALIAMQQLNELATAPSSKQDKEQQRRKELRQLKKKYSLTKEGYGNQDPALRNPAYGDRAAERRRTVGSDNPYQPDDQPASVDRAITSTNVGHKMLSKMGWSEGQSLGKGDRGIKEPIQAVVHSRNAGLGSGIAQSMDQIQHSRQRNKNWDKARGRYNLIMTPRQPEAVGDHVKNRPTWVQGATQRLDPRGQVLNRKGQSGSPNKLNVVQLPLASLENRDGDASGAAWEVVDIWDESMEANAQEEEEKPSENLKEQSIDDDDVVAEDQDPLAGNNEEYERAFLGSDGTEKVSLEARPSVVQKLDADSSKQTSENDKETRTITPDDSKNVNKCDLESVEATILENVPESSTDFMECSAEEHNRQMGETGDELPSRKPDNKETNSEEASSKKLELSNSKNPTNPGKIQLKWAKGGREKVEKLATNLVVFEESESEDEETAQGSVVHKNESRGKSISKQGRGGRGDLGQGSKRATRWSMTKDSPVK